MVEEYKYQDKRVWKDENDKGSLKNLVNKEFKEIEKKYWIWYRDDQEIRNAWRNICNKIINEIKNDKSKIYGQRALKPLTQLIRDLKEEYNNMKWMSLFTNNEDKINQVAQRIDNAENETLKRLKLNNTKQESRNLIKNSPMFSLEKKKWKQNWKDVIYDTWNIIFTKASNSARIDQALKWFFDNPNTVYEIDYSGCTNEKIKDKMTWLTLTKTCYLRYDKNQKTYTIRDKDGNWILNRAYIREWVKLIPAWVRQWQSYVEEEKQKRNLWNIDNTQINKLIKSMLKDMPSAGKLTQAEQEDLAKKTENRVTELLKKAKKLWYDLESECVTKKHVWRWHMELHLNSGSSEVDRTIRGNDGSYNKTLWEKLDDFIDSNEWEYKTYLTNRVKTKWQELDKLTKTETSNISKNWEKDWRKNLNPKEREKKEQEAEKHKQEVLYWIWLLEKMVDNYKETEWDSWLDSDDRKLVQIKQLIRNAKSSINNADTLDDNALINIFINPIWEKRASFKNTANTYKPQYNQFIKVFLWKKQDQISAIRSLWWRNRIFDNTETSFLAEEIEWNDNLWVKKPEIQKCINNIKNRTSMSIYNQDWSINQKVKWRYDNTYASAKKWTDSLITLFVWRWRLPENWKDEEKEIRKCMDNLKDKLNSLNNQCENISLSVDDIIKAQHEKRLELEQKENKTENDMKILQSLVYLEDNPNEARESYQKAIEINNIELKYWNLWQIVKWWLLSALGELWWWITWKNADIYNDIKWYWWFDLSDENAKIAWDLIWDILEEVVILAVAIAIGTVTAWAGTAAIMWARVTKWWAKVIKYSKYISKLTNKLAKPIWKILKNTGNRAKTTKIWKRTVKTAERIKNTKLWKNIIKIKTDQNAANAAISQENRAEILHLWRKENKTLWEMYKLWSLVNKEWGAWIKTVSAIFEWTWFHLSSTAIHNAISWVDLTRWLNPFGYTEWPNWERISNFKWYIQSIAFLSILKVIGQPIQNLTQASLTSVLWEKISANTLWKILQNIGSIIWEFWSLTVTDEAINVFFEWELKELTVEDAIHSIGMILWLRAYWKIKQIANLKIKEYNRNKKELKAEINGKKIIVNEDILSEKANEEIKKTEEELKEIKERISKIKTEIKEIEKQISKIENNIEITNHERLANEISDRRRKSNNGNNPERYIDNNGKPKNIPINKHYEWNIVDWKMIIIDKRTWKETTIKFDAKKRINDLLGNDQWLEKLDIEIAERMILGIKNWHIEVWKNRTEAEKIVDWFPEENLEIVNLENWNYGVRRKTNIRKLREQKTKLNNQLKWLENEYKNKRTALNKKINNEKNNNLDKDKESRENEQNKYKSEIENAQKKISELPEELRSESMKNLLRTKDISELSPEEIKKIQKEIWLKWDDINWIFDWKSYKKLEDYINQKKLEINNDNTLWEKREKLKTYKEKFKFLTENFHIDWLTRTEIESLTKEQIIKLKELKDLWFSLSIWNTSINLLKLRNNEISSLKQLKDLWANIFSYTEELSKLKPEEINTLKQLKDLWVNLSHDVRELSKLTPEQINTLKELHNLWVDLSYDVRELSKLKPEQINLLKELKDLWIDISEVFPLYWRELISYKPEEIKKLKQLKDLWINVWEDINLCLSIELTEANTAIIKLLWENWKALLNPHEVFDSWGLIDALKELKGKWIDIENILAFESKVKYEEYWIQKSEIESYNNYNRWKIIENIETYVQKIIWEKRNIWVAEILNSVRVDILTLPKQERMYFMKRISNIVEKFNTIRKYLDFEHGPYKSPKELLLAMRWITDPNIIARITNDITVKQHGTWLHFFVWDETSYEIINHQTLDLEGINKSGWFNTKRSAIKELEWTLSVWNSKDPGIDWSNYKYWTIWHEGQHNRNSYFMRDKNSWHREPIIRAKDEITAFLRDGRWIFKAEKWWNTIEKILTTPASEKWLYQYNLKWEAWETHKQQVRELLKYANDLVELTKDPTTWMTREKVISLLSDVPAEWWKDLHSNIMEAVALHNQSTQSPEKIKSLRWRFVEKIKEWSDKVKLVRDLANWWNSKFSNYKIDLDGPEFWRTGNAKKENIVSEITTAKSIDEVKHILNNPKYSHISWWKNNKSWMEISAIVDDVIAGKYAISYLPSEIRNTVKKFMN